jgi:DNA-binding helix-hairpin-helix protein with protein kinase domain
MAVLKAGDKVSMKLGGEATVISEFGSGGQGIVYMVSYNGKDYALKWYHKGVFKGKEKAFYANLENNIAKGAPTDSFLWPIGITSVLNDQFGYIMDIRPQGYEELTAFFVGSVKKKQARFKSFEAIAIAAINIIQAYRELHNSGYSYQDINNGNFFIHPSSGKVLICDNDNVSPYGTNLGIMGKQRYMAPEIVRILNDPDKASDRFSLSVILFRLLFINHPLEGRYSTPPCMTKDLERKYYGTDPVFIFDPKDSKNRPIPGTDHNLKLFWNVYPLYVKEAFAKAFSKDVMLKRAPRIIEKEWLDIFFRLKADIIKCTNCHEEMFASNGTTSKCIECGKTPNKWNTLKTSSYNVPLFPGSKLYLWHVDSSEDDIQSVLGEIVANKNNPSLYGIRNLSTLSWKVNLVDGTQRAVTPNEVVPLQSGFVIEFGNNPQNCGKIF